MDLQIFSSQALVAILAVGGLFAFGKNIVLAVLQLHAYAQTKKGQAALQVTLLLVSFAILIVLIGR